MASEYSSYSKLRSVARKRAERLTESGFTTGFSFPTVKELKQQGISAKAATRAVESFLNAPSTVRQARRETERPVFIPTSTGAVVTTQAQAKAERARAASRERSRRYRDRVRNLSKQDRLYIKAAKKLGLHITPSQAKAFSEYMDFRFAQGSDSVHYKIARYVEDFAAAMEKLEYTPDEILEDFQSYLLSRAIAIDNAKNMKGYKKAEIDRLMSTFIGKDESDYSIPERIGSADIMKSARKRKR